MNTPTEIVRQAYDAFLQGDVDALLNLVAADVDWEFEGSPQLAYAGNRRSRQQVRDFFRDLQRTDDIQAFEPREFIAAGPQVTVLGWEKSTALDSGTKFDTQWCHVFTVKDGQITRWRGFSNTAARYGK